ncbi:hypothetical protein [Draconibacterium halophilum]|uniref:Uncharacterized protein n=1 Tax=Draconibacterium halophilum TaxID=2706887 RepID=A0A6C0RCU5_9BACT|nr:hypothetical protein [Draconibacterium halophilum]QIA07929.1 hypothetical protein G0Q07_09395 [Draconibacterium halophilum]
MENSIINQDQLSDKQLLATLKTAVATSKRSLYEDGILLILWGTSFTIGFFLNYYKSTHLVVRSTRNLIDSLNIIAAVLLIGFSIYYLFLRKPKFRTYTAISTRFVWIGIIIAHNLNVIVTKSLLQEVTFALIHPLQMVLLGFALFVTGGIYRYKLLSISGVIMWIAAVLCARVELADQYLIRAIANFICFVIPGVLMYLQSKKLIHV